MTDILNEMDIIQSVYLLNKFIEHERIYNIAKNVISEYLVRNLVNQEKKNKQKKTKEKKREVCKDNVDRMSYCDL